MVMITQYSSELNIVLVNLVQYFKRVSWKHKSLVVVGCTSHHFVFSSCQILQVKWHYTQSALNSAGDSLDCSLPFKTELSQYSDRGLLKSTLV